ncbi:portal protein [Janthinobacterium sp. B9-8]|uniref:portal protein n=1 Tax=Janthinobacterium sp. B9-8 TaxID=1236179 RepID=UPI00061D0FBD|nr:hypothetical protein [Janthinobacterium sp. B9-8]AMC34739.1 hypothetical protein VN23_09015 [Janthinobacterium sp. B9-8]
MNDQAVQDPIIGEVSARPDIALLAMTLQKDVDERCSKRAAVEKRWHAATLAYKGKYDSVTENQLAPNKSKAFYKGTKKLCNFAESRLAEMVLPTDDRNWSIKPTPLPDLPPEFQAKAPQLLATAMASALKMQTLMDDQLTQANYNSVMRQAIASAVRLGIGIMKSPVVVNREKRRYVQREVAHGVMEFVIDVSQDFSPSVNWVDPWNFYPTTGAKRIEDCDSTFERHPMTRKDLRELAKTPGFDPNAVRELLKREPGFRSDQYQQNRAVSDDQADIDKTLYNVWEFHGSLPLDAAAALCGNDPVEADPLQEKRVIVWFCDEIVLKAVEYPHDDEALPYNCFNWSVDPDSIWGFGLPDDCENSQRAANSALRMLWDNAAFSVLPQIIIDQSAITPQDGRYEIRPGKEWLLKKSVVDVRTAFSSVEIPTRIGDLIEIFKLAQQMMEDETGLPMLMQTGQEPQVTQTATGTAMLMNSASTPLRRLVRQIDDCITRPVIKSIYQYNMQFHNDDSVKGDYDIVALGSSSLLVREQQTSGLIEVLQLAQGSPVLAPLTKFPELYRKLVASMQINADGVIKTEDELAEETKQQGQQAPSTEQMKLQLEQAKVQIEEQRLELAKQKQTFEQILAQSQIQLKRNELQVRAMDASSGLQSDQINAQREHERIVSHEALQVAKMNTDQQGVFQKIQSMERMNAIKIDAENRRFNAEIQTKITQGSGI